jgi:hypothetical protein
MSSLQFNDKMEWCWWRRMYGRWGRLYNFILVFLVLESHSEMKDFLRTFASMAPRSPWSKYEFGLSKGIKDFNIAERCL